MDRQTISYDDIYMARACSDGRRFFVKTWGMHGRPTIREVAGALAQNKGDGLNWWTWLARVNLVPREVWRAYDKALDFIRGTCIRSQSCSCFRRQEAWLQYYSATGILTEEDVIWEPAR